MTPANIHSQNAQRDSNQCIELIKSPLNRIVPLNDAITTRITRIIFHFHPNNFGLKLLRNWFANSDLFDTHAADRVWHWMTEASQRSSREGSSSFVDGWREFPLGWLTPETILDEAKRHGWSPHDKDDRHAEMLRETRVQDRLQWDRQLEQSRVGWLQTDIRTALRREPPLTHPAFKALGLTPRSPELKFLGIDPGLENLIVPFGDGARWFAAQSINLSMTKWLKYSLMENQAHWHPLGVPSPEGEILIADGLFNGIALHISTGLATAVGVGAKNIGLVAKAIRLNFPKIEITICPDQKISGAKSKYFTQIDNAAREVDAFVALPWDAKTESNRTFLDVFVNHGPAGVANNIELAKHGFPEATIHDREVRHG